MPADPDSTQTPGYEDLPSELLTRLDALSQKLGVAAEHIWEVLVRQAYVEAVGWLTALFVGFLATLIFGLWTRKDESGLSQIALFVSLVFLAIVLFGSLLQVPTLLFNPEYHALSEIKYLLSD